MGATQQILLSQNISGGSPSFPGGITAQVWLKAESLSGLSNNDPVDTWPDSSGNGNDYTAAGGQRPLYKTTVTGLAFPCVQGDGSDDRMTHDTTNSYLTVIGIVNTGTLASFRAWLGERSSSGNNGEPWLVGVGGSGGGELLARSGVGDGSTIITTTGGTPAVASDTTYCISVKRSETAGTSNVNMWKDGVDAGSGSAAGLQMTTDQSCILNGYFGGALNDPWPGAIAEILFYTSALSDVDRGLVEAALMAKFGL